MAKRLVLGEYDQLHHFIGRRGPGEASPVETELLVQADRLVGRPAMAVLVIDDTCPCQEGARIRWGVGCANMLRALG